MGFFRFLNKQDENSEEIEEICQDCGEVHKNSITEKAAEDLTNNFFPKVWKEAKEDLKELSKKELAEKMFFIGALNSMYAIKETMEHAIGEEAELSEKEKEYFKMTDDEKYEYLLKCEEEPDCGFCNFGMKLEKKGEFEKAEKLYIRDCEMYPEDFSGNESLGLLYKKMKKTELAEKHLTNALALAIKQREEEPDCIDDEVIDNIKKELKEIQK